ncbi:ABC transporter permease subunit [Wenzhouxiangellaceae bacterium CH-27]|uniref:ABC transporter permease subunit n=1 Tax=Elongatibacter sediminis TaxID=3119006 RepID=A0AAW9REF1_9GAMM
MRYCDEVGGAVPVFLLVLPAFLFLAAFYLFPLIQIVALSFQGGGGLFENYGSLLSDPLRLTVLLNTLKLSAGVALLCLVLGYPVAYLMVNARPERRSALMLIVLASVWVSILVRTYAWMVLLARRGPVNALLQFLGLTDEPLTLLYTDFSVYVGMVHVLLPFMILPLYSVMQRIDLGLVRSARSLGCGGFLGFWFVFLPLSLPGVVAGVLLVFLVSLGFFITPALLGGAGDVTFVMLIEQELAQFLNWGVASAMSIVLLVATLVLVALYRFLMRSDARLAGADNRILGLLSVLMRSALRSRAVRRTLGVAGYGAEGSVAWLRRIVALVVRAVPWLVVGFLVLPLLVIVPLSLSSSPFLEFPPPGITLRWYVQVFSRMDWLGPIAVSVRLALVVGVGATLLGLLASVALVRGSFPGKGLLAGFIVSPMIVPVMVLAVAMQYFMARLGLAGTLSGLALSHVVLALPFVVVVLTGALQTVDTGLERAAQALGATPFVAFVRVTLPLIRPALLTSGLFAFLVSFDELVIALFLAGPATKTLPKRMWEAVREEIDPATAAVAVLVTGVCVLGLLLAERARSRLVRRSNLHNLNKVFE